MNNKENPERAKQCAYCGGPAPAFRDALSRKEYRISGLFLTEKGHGKVTEHASRLSVLQELGLWDDSDYESWAQATRDELKRRDTK